MWGHSNWLEVANVIKVVWVTFLCMIEIQGGPIKSSPFMA